MPVFGMDLHPCVAKLAPHPLRTVRELAIAYNTFNTYLG